jgi:DNA-binding MarR family transcriptional regulator
MVMVIPMQTMPKASQRRAWASEGTAGEDNHPYSECQYRQSIVSFDTIMPVPDDTGPMAGEGGDAGVTVLLTQLTKAVYRRTAEAELGMRYREFVVLGYLYAQSGISQHELGEVLLMDANNLVIVLNELERSGYALRRRDPEDRRRHLVEITPEGLVALKKVESAVAAVESELLVALSPTERETLRALLARAVDGAALTGAEA